jgi:hypothetical protein
MKEDRFRRTSPWIALVVTGVLLLGLVISSGGRSRWPFSYWTMYTKVHAKAVRRVRWHQLVAEDEDGNSHRVWPKDLLTLDDDGSPQPSGPALIRAALRAGTQQPAHQASLVRRIEKVIGRRVREVQVRELFWKVRFDVHPAFDKNKPDSEQVLATLGPKP